MRPTHLPLLAAALLLAAGTSFVQPAYGQEGGGSIRTMENPSVEEVAKLEDWTTRQMNQLRSGLPEDVASARDMLVKELRMPGASNAYKTILSKVVVAMGDNLVKSEKILVRINALTVLGNAHSLDAVPIVAQAIGDPAAGVRYKACQATCMLIEPTPSERRSIGADREGLLVKALAAKIGTEPDAHVYREMTETLAVVGSPLAQEALMAALDGHLSKHVSNIEETFEVEVRAINGLYQKFIQKDEKGPLLMHLIATAYAHEKLAAAQLAGDAGVAKRIAGDRKALIQTCDKLIRAQYVRLNPGVQIPPDLSPMLALGNRWKEVKQAIDQWQPLLKAPPLSIPESKLK